MAVILATGIRNAQAEAIEAFIGASALLRLYASNADVLCEIQLPADWMSLGDDGVVEKLGTWQGVGTAIAGTGRDATSFQILDSTGTTTGVTGTVSHTSGGGDMTLDNTNIAVTQVITVVTFTFTAGNAP